MNVPMNLQDAKNAIRSYYNKDTGMFYTHIKDQYTTAMSIMKLYPKDSTKVIVMDLDETILDKSQFGSDIDYGYTQENQIRGWTITEMPCFVEAKEFMLKNMELKHLVYIITGRREQYRSATIAQLQYNDINQGKYFWSLIMKPNDSTLSTQEFKTQQRAALYDAGLQIIVNIGDKEDDLLGGYSENRVLLPNAMY